VRLLLDTHIAIWAVEDNPRLPQVAREVLSNPEAVPHVGVVSLWEIAIKHRLGRRGRTAMPMSAADARDFFGAAGFSLIPVKADHIQILEQLPSHHEDPFDRLIVATALSEPLRLLTHDARLARYSDSVMVVCPADDGTAGR
jgi:PIN domain nuclease of toxin-antitoxin system